jgi:hypothetical protein
MGTPLIVGLSGKKQSGKDTICSAVYDYLHSCSDLDDSISVYSFADALKQKVCKDVLGLTEEQVNGTDEQKNSPTIYKWDSLTDGIRYTNSVETEPIRKGGTRSQYEEVPVLRSGFMTAREVMQATGTDIFRNYFDDDVWVNATFRNIRKENKKVAIISDVRFPGEVDRVINEGGYIIRLSRNTCQEDSHSSEVALDDYDFTSWGSRVCMVDNRDMGIEKQNKIAINYIKALLL